MLDVRISSCSNGIRKIRKISMTEETGTGDCPHLFHRHHRLLLPRNATHAYKCNLFPKNSEGELRSLRRSMHDQHTFWMRGKQGRKKRRWTKNSVAFQQNLCHQTCNLSAHMFSFTRFRRLLLLIIFIFLNIPRAGRQIDITAFEKQITMAKDLDGKVVLVAWPQRLNASLSQHQAASCIYAVLLIILILLFPFTWYIAWCFLETQLQYPNIPVRSMPTTWFSWIFANPITTQLLSMAQLQYCSWPSKFQSPTCCGSRTPLSWFLLTIFLSWLFVAMSRSFPSKGSAGGNTGGRPFCPVVRRFPRLRPLISFGRITSRIWGGEFYRQFLKRTQGNSSVFGTHKNRRKRLFVVRKLQLVNKWITARRQVTSLNIEIDTSECKNTWKAKLLSSAFLDIFHTTQLQVNQAVD